MCWSKHAWQRIDPLYQTILEHPFIKELKEGSLPIETFQFYMMQDAHYLQSFSKSLAILASKTVDSNMAIQFMQFAQNALLAEHSLHESYFKNYGIKKLIPIAPDCHHYISYLKSNTLLEDFPIGIASILPCFWIYEEVGKIILAETNLHNHPYRQWIEMYAGVEFGTGVKKAIEIADLIAHKSSATTQEKMIQAFETASQLEWLFWDGAYYKRLWKKNL